MQGWRKYILIGTSALWVEPREVKREIGGKTVPPFSSSDYQRHIQGWKLKLFTKAILNNCP